MTGDAADGDRDRDRGTARRLVAGGVAVLLTGAWLALTLLVLGAGVAFVDAAAALVGLGGPVRVGLSAVAVLGLCGLAPTLADRLVARGARALDAAAESGVDLGPERPWVGPAGSRCRTPRRCCC